MTQIPLLSLDLIYEPIVQDLQKVEDILSRELGSSDEVAGEVAKQLIEGKGKRLRPALVLFSSRANSLTSESVHRLAAAMEMIHVATLVHDDVLDEASLRRNQATINAIFGNKIALLLGDYLYAKAIEQLANLGDPKLLQWVSMATTQMCLGEFTQAYIKELPSLDEAQYLSLIDKKTARLMAACCQCGAYLSGGNSEVLQVLYEFGLNFGLGFQIIDDCLDIMGDERLLGKPCGLDLLRGKVTLPIITLYHTAPQYGSFLERLYSNKVSEKESETLKPLLLETGSLERSMDRARDYMELAKEALGRLGNPSCKESLLALTDYALYRQR